MFKLYWRCSLLFYADFTRDVAAKQFKCNAYLAVVLAGILLHPHLVELKSAGEAVTFLGIPMVLASYSASVVPMI